MMYDNDNDKLDVVVEVQCLPQDLDTASGHPALHGGCLDTGIKLYIILYTSRINNIDL